MAPGRPAEKPGVSRQTIHAVETEKYDPGLPLASKVARLFLLPLVALAIFWRNHLKHDRAFRLDHPPRPAP